MMTVSEFIEELKKYDGNMEIFQLSDRNSGVDPELEIQYVQDSIGHCLEDKIVIYNKNYKNKVINKRKAVCLQCHD